MPDFSLQCSECGWRQLIPAGTRTYDLVRCGNCQHPLTGNPPDVLERIGEWRRNYGRSVHVQEVLTRQWEKYLDGTYGEFQQWVARALRIADADNAAKIQRAWPLLYAAWECRS